MSATFEGTLGTVHPVGNGLYAYVQPDASWCINNTGFLVGPESVVAVDSCATERRTRALLEAIRATTDKPVDLLVDTHHHPDHVNGNGLMGAATIIAHERCRTRMLAQVPFSPDTEEEAGDPLPRPDDWGAIDRLPPDLTFTDRLDLWRGERRVELRHMGRRAHTDNDVIVWVPDESVLFAGDLVMHGSMPMVLHGSVGGILETLRELVALAPLVVVPGHGEVGGIELLEMNIRFYELVWSAALAAREAGTSALDAARRVELGEFAGLLDGERLVANLHRALAELEDPGVGDLPVDEVFPDMVEYNGGPLRCVA